MNFETVYIEEDTKEDKNTIDILGRIKFKNLIYCNSYSEIFNPKNQNFRIQKIKPDIILAKKKNNFIMNTPKILQLVLKKTIIFLICLIVFMTVNIAFFKECLILQIL